MSRKWTCDYCGSNFDGESRPDGLYQVKVSQTVTKRDKHYDQIKSYGFNVIAKKDMCAECVIKLLKLNLESK